MIKSRSCTTSPAGSSSGFDVTVRQGNAMIGLLCVLGMTSCMLTEPPPLGPPPAPEPPAVAVLPAELAGAPEVAELKSAIEGIATEVDDQKQREKATAAREQFDAFVRERELDAEEVAALRRWIAWTAYKRHIYGDRSFLSGYILSGEYATFSSRYPLVLNEVGLTTTQAWVDVLLLPTDSHHKANSRVKEIIRVVGGREPRPDGEGFVYIDLEALPIERLLREGNTYDDVLSTLYGNEPLVTVRALMRIAEPDEAKRNESVAAVERAAPRLSELVVAIQRERDRGPQVPIARGDREDNPLEKEGEAIVLELADTPHWPVHLYLLRYLFRGSDSDQVLDRIEAHGNPITARWLKDHPETYR